MIIYCNLYVATLWPHSWRVAWQLARPGIQGVLHGACSKHVRTAGRAPGGRRRGTLRDVHGNWDLARAQRAHDSHSKCEIARAMANLIYCTRQAKVNYYTDTV